jgi:hypothetical protein
MQATITLKNAFGMAPKTFQFLSCRNVNLQRLSSPLETLGSTPTLNIVNDHFEMMKAYFVEQSFTNHLWTVIFNATSMEGGRQLIKQYFTNFFNLNLKSKMFPLVLIDQKLQLWEVYRVASDSDLTISLACQLDIQSERVEFLNKKPLYERRNNLRGVHLQVGVMMKSMFISSDKEVKFH